MSISSEQIRNNVASILIATALITILGWWLTSLIALLKPGEDQNLTFGIALMFLPPVILWPFWKIMSIRGSNSRPTEGPRIADFSIGPGWTWDADYLRFKVTSNKPFKLPRKKVRVAVQIGGNPPANLKSVEMLHQNSIWQALQNYLLHQQQYEIYCNFDAHSEYRHQIWVQLEHGEMKGKFVPAKKWR